MARLKVAVVGLGAIGAQVLWQLAKRPDIDVVGFESHTPGHGFGASGGDTRVFRTVQYRDRRYVPLLTRSNRIWEELQTTTNRRLKITTGGYVVGPANHTEIIEGQAGALEYGLDCEMLDTAELRRRYPVNAFDDDDVAILDRNAGVLRPELSNITAIALAVALGAKVRERTRVTDIRSAGTGIEVIGDGTVTELFDHVVVATGAWATKLLPGLASLVVPKKLTSAWFFARDRDALAGHPSFIRTAPTHCYAVPSADGLSLKVGLSSVSHEVVSNPDDSDYIIRDRNYQPFEDLIRDYFPGLHPAPYRTEAYFEGYTSDSRPVVQRVADNLTVMAGFSGHGFKLATVFGEIGAALALGDDVDRDIAFLQRDDSHSWS